MADTDHIDGVPADHLIGREAVVSAGPRRAFKLFLVAGEHSGDALGSKLMAALNAQARGREGDEHLVAWGVNDLQIPGGTPLVQHLQNASDVHASPSNNTRMPSIMASGRHGHPGT